MVVRIKAALTRAASRRLAGVHFCDGCARVCDATCQADAHRRRLHQSLARHTPTR